LKIFGLECNSANTPFVFFFFSSKSTHCWFKLDRFSGVNNVHTFAMKQSSLQTRVSHFLLEKFHEIYVIMILGLIIDILFYETFFTSSAN